MSGEFAIEGQPASGYRVAGRIDVVNAATALAAGVRFAGSGQRLEVDLSRLQSADSVTLAVLLAWSAQARQRGGELVYRGIPARLRSIAHLSDAEALLGADAVPA